MCCDIQKHFLNCFYKENEECILINDWVLQINKHSLNISKDCGHKHIEINPRISKHF